MCLHIAALPGVQHLVSANDRNLAKPAVAFAILCALGGAVFGGLILYIAARFGRADALF